MAITHTFAPSYRTGSGSVSLPSETITGDQEINTEVTIPASTTNHQVNIDFLDTAIKGLVLKCSKAVTLKTNSTSVPDDTIALAANKAIFWRAGADVALCPFTAAVTTFYITNAGAEAADFVMYAVLDQVA